MAGVSAVFLAVPFATGGGVADNFVRAADGAGIGGAARHIDTGSQLLLPPPSRQGELWLELKAFYEQQGFNFDGAKFISINDIQMWAGPKRGRVWLGSKDISGLFDVAGNKIPLEGGYIGKDARRIGPILRDGVADANVADLTQALGIPPGKFLGGMTGEDAARYFKESTEDRLLAMLDYTATNNGEILFVLHRNILQTHYTRIELQHILANPNFFFPRTKFIVDWYY
jgi:hypothetical protein